MFELWKKSKMRLSEPVGADDNEPQREISESLEENIRCIRNMFGECYDLVIKETEVAGVRIAFAALDGMYNGLHASVSVVEPMLSAELLQGTGESVYRLLCEKYAGECDSKEAQTINQAADFLISGFMILFVDCVTVCRAFSVQGYPKRTVQPPETESQENGSREAFTDMYKDNVTLVRRRIKSPHVRFETLVAGETSKTQLCICYHEKRAAPDIVDGVKTSLKNMKLDIVPGEGAIKPFLEDKRLSFFSSVGTTERPDVVAAKISEGRVCVIVDGTPYAVIVPYLFVDNFHSMDDYLNRPYYAAITRILKLCCFVIAVFLPGVYVAVGTFHQEIFPSSVIADIVASLRNTPFPLVVESLVIHFIYEIVREAGLRMPKAVGHTVSIVGALVIGDAAVTAGLISAPMLIVVALTAICSAVLPQLHQPASVLRFIFIVLGGIMGLYGIILGLSLVVTDLCSINSFGIPFTAPFSPFDRFASRDSIIFTGWKSAGKRFIQIQNIRGARGNESEK